MNWILYLFEKSLDAWNVKYGSSTGHSRKDLTEQIVAASQDWI